MMKVRMYRGLRLESSTVGTDIYNHRGTLVAIKVPLDEADPWIDAWLFNPDLPHHPNYRRWATPAAFLDPTP